jgi:hypothetical protein
MAMGDMSSLQMSEDPLADYRPFLRKLRRILEREGEVSTLQAVAQDSKLVKTLQNIYRLAFQAIEDVSKLSPEKLVGYATFGFDLSYPIRTFFSPSHKQGKGLIDFGEEIPSAYITWLLGRPYPFASFLHGLSDIERSRICLAEIEHRSLEYPILAEIEQYKLATPEREARQYLMDMSPSERADMAERYGLKALSKLELTIEKVLGMLADIYEREHGTHVYLYEFPKLEYKITSDFPRFEKSIFKKLGGKGVVCDLLIRCVSIDHFGLSIKGGYSPQEHEANEALTKIGEILKIKGIAFNYKDRLLGMAFSKKDKQEEAEITALEGLGKGMETWAGKDIEDIILAGLTDHLKHSLKKAVVNKLLDEIDKVKTVEIEVGDKLGDKERVKVQRAIPSSALGDGKTDKDTGESQLELIAARQELVETPFEDELDDRERLNSILQEARLTDRQRLVIDLTRQERNDTEIALALKKAFGKRVKDGNVRKLKHDAIEKLRRYAQKE